MTFQKFKFFTSSLIDIRGLVGRVIFIKPFFVYLVCFAYYVRLNISFRILLVSISLLQLQSVTVYICHFPLKLVVQFHKTLQYRPHNHHFGCTSEYIRCKIGQIDGHHGAETLTALFTVILSLTVIFVSSHNGRIRNRALNDN